MISHKLVFCLVAVGCLFSAPHAAAAPMPGSMEESASAAADLKPDQIKAGVLATCTPKIEMRAVETRVVINGEMRTIIHYVPCVSDFKTGQKPGMNVSEPSQPQSEALPKTKRETALDTIISTTPAPAPVTRDKPKSTEGH